MKKYISVLIVGLLILALITVYLWSQAERNLTATWDAYAGTADCLELWEVDMLGAPLNLIQGNIPTTDISLVFPWDVKEVNRFGLRAMRVDWLGDSLYSDFAYFTGDSRTPVEPTNLVVE